MGKKGFLLGEETLKIIIAVICIMFLVYLLVSLYLSGRDNSLELAKSSLDHLIEGLNAGNSRIEIYNPDGWGIASFPFSSPIPFSDQLPNICVDNKWESCICICSQPKGSAGATNYFMACNTKNKGECRESDFSVDGGAGNNIDIQNPPVVLNVDYENKIIQRNYGT